MLSCWELKQSSEEAFPAAFLFDCVTQPALFYILIVTSIGPLKNNLLEKKNIQMSVSKIKIVWQLKVSVKKKKKEIHTCHQNTYKSENTSAKKEKCSKSSNRTQEKNVPFSLLMMGELRDLRRCLKFV